VPFRGFSPRAAALPHREPIPPCRWSPGAHRGTGGSLSRSTVPPAATPEKPRLRGFSPRGVALRSGRDQPPRRSLPSSVSFSSRSSTTA
jgi:hypothetical protein